MFALGVVLYEMATGQRPFTGTAVADVIDRILNRQPAPPQELNPRVSPPLGAVIQKCLEKEPARRYQNAEDVAIELRRLLAPPSPASHTGHTRRLYAATIALGFVAIAALFAAWSLAERPSAPSAPLAWEQLTDFPDSPPRPRSLPTDACWPSSAARARSLDPATCISRRSRTASRCN